MQQKQHDEKERKQDGIRRGWMRVGEREIKNVKYQKKNIDDWKKRRTKKKKDRLKMIKLMNGSCTAKRVDTGVGDDSAVNRIFRIRWKFSKNECCLSPINFFNRK